jgi:hypothetical protein
MLSGCAAVRFFDLDAKKQKKKKSQCKHLVGWFYNPFSQNGRLDDTSGSAKLRLEKKLHQKEQPTHSDPEHKASYDEAAA